MKADAALFSSPTLFSSRDQDEFTHDGAGRILTAGKGRYNNTVTFTYDDGGRIESEALTIGMTTWTISHTYDDAGRRDQTT